ncbi:P-loop containing nucleoside triphosphate hydrolase (ATPase) [Colletotrichum sojae]|uniref:P-loop containing nucleoside triphosphate hydrolase (ATPase) n=1 Tax=Colletotrichum sojae TaxID=2175907 RepID=A0A8H6IRU2_9PEZI|nr:P-loop containing nucleoside triphosphate hydrolase (ATPase) [Colletotrichum sojae]
MSTKVDSSNKEGPATQQAVTEAEERSSNLSAPSDVGVHGANDRPESREHIDPTDLNHEAKPKKPRIGYRTEYRNRQTDDIISEKTHEPGTQQIIDQADGPIFEIVTTYKVAPPGGGFRQDCLSRSSVDLCVRERQAGEHLRILLEYLDKEVMQDVRQEQERNKRGFSTFEWRWVAFKPGVFMIRREYDEWDAAVVHSVTGGVLENPPKPWMISRWGSNYNGRYIQRVWKPHFNWPQFDGEKSVRTPNFDMFFVDANKDGTLPNNEVTKNEVITDLVNNGRRFFNMLWEPQNFRHQGKTVRTPHNEINSLVMVDFASFQSIHPETRAESIGEEDIRNWKTECTCDICLRRKKDGNHSRGIGPAFVDFLMSIGKNRILKDHRALLFPSSVDVYVFRTRSWEKVHIRNLSEPDFDENIINHLVMNEQRLLTLKALSKSFARVSKHGEPLNNPRWSADFVRGKGNGLILLLHGKPGVGKTCTAECIAEFTRRPLMVLTSSDIGTDPKEVENNLTDNFKRAMSWGAVLLIDEADVFMERRTTSDLTRNSLVAGFLRALEFYDGILFLTTNRVGSFDDAFISRIHIQLYYADFTDDERQKVWKTFIDKLARERGDIIRLTMEAKDYIQWTRKQGIKWNGREIRNAFQTAVALAEYDAEKDSEGRILVKDDHLRAVVELSQDFKGYLDGLHNRDEAKRAEMRNERLDSYGREK